MEWEGRAIILSARAFNETSGLVRLFSEAHGVYGGVAKGALSKRQRGVYQSGNMVHAVWRARLSEQLGTLRAELLTPTAALLLQDRSALAALTSACALIETALAERHPEPTLYPAFEMLIAALGNTSTWRAQYVQFEITLLQACGYGIDLHACAATETTEDLIYVSPRSGRAVSGEAGAPYRDKLLSLPTFLTEATLRPISDAEYAEGLQLSGYFLEHWLFHASHRTMPAARKRLSALMPIPA